MRWNRLAYIGLLAIVCALLVVASGTLADKEPNDESKDAESIGPGDHSGTLTYDVDEYDYYRFQVTEGQSIMVSLTSTTGQDFIYGYLLDWELGTYFDLSSKDSVPDSDRWWTSNETEAQTWYFYVTSDTEGGSYNFTLSITDQDDGGFGKDAGGDMAGADTIGPGDVVTGYLADDDDYDTYRFKAGGGDIIKVTFSARVGGDFHYLDLMDWEGYDLIGLCSKEETVDTGTWYTALETETTWMYIMVQYDTEEGSYEFTLEVDHQNDGDTGTDAPKTTADALVVQPGTITGHMEDEDEMDVYKLELGGGDHIHVEFTSDSQGDFQYLNLVDWEDWTLWTLEAKEGSTAEERYYTANETETKWYYLVVSLDTAQGSYGITLEMSRQDDAGSGGDVAIACGEAYPIADGEHAGLLAGEDEGDAYKVTVQAGWNITVRLLNQGSVAAEAAIVGDCGEAPMWTVSSKDGTPGEGTWTVPAGVGAGSYWHVIVTPGTGWTPGTYSMTIETDTSGADSENPVITFPDPPTKTTEGKDAKLKLTVTDNGAIKGVTLYFRIDDEVAWTEVPMTADGTTYTGVVPKDRIIEIDHIYFYIVAEDEYGNIESFGSESSPMSMQVTKPPEDDTPGFGLLLAVAALGAVAAVAPGRRR